MTDFDIVKELSGAEEIVALRFEAGGASDESEGGKSRRKGGGAGYKAKYVKPIIIIVVGKGGTCVRHERPEATVYICGAKGLK